MSLDAEVETGVSRLGPASSRGAFRDRHGRGRRDADAGGAADESASLRTAKSCGPDAPTLVSSWRSNAPMTVANKPGHRGARRKPLKPLRGECRVVPV